MRFEIKYVFTTDNGEEFSIKTHHAVLVWNLYNRECPVKVEAIRFIKDEYKIGLREAKDVCDFIGSRVSSFT
jgi:ribosomal protein L7/L12